MFCKQAFAADVLANGAGVGVVAAGRAIFPPKINDLQMKRIPALPRKKPLGILFGADHIFPGTKGPAIHQAVDVSIDRKRGFTKGLGHHHRGRFVPYARQGFQGVQVWRDFPLIFFQQNLRKLMNRLGLAGRKPAGFDDLPDFIYLQFHHFLGAAGFGK